MQNKSKTFEENIAELEKVIEKLEIGEVDLAESIKLYEKGVLLSDNCSEILKNSRQKIEVITKTNDENL